MKLMVGKVKMSKEHKKILKNKVTPLRNISYIFDKLNKDGYLKAIKDLF